MTSANYGSVDRNKVKTQPEMKDDFYSGKSSTFDRLKSGSVSHDTNTSSFNSTADSGNSLATVIENKIMNAQSEASLTNTIGKKKETRRSLKKRNSSANSMSSISKSGSTSRSRSNNSRTITVSSRNCSSHSCSGSYTTSSSPCSGSFSSSCSSSRSSSVRSAKTSMEINGDQSKSEIECKGDTEEIISASIVEMPSKLSSAEKSEKADEPQEGANENVPNASEPMEEDNQEENKTNAVNDQEAHLTEPVKNEPIVEENGDTNKDSSGGVNSGLYSCCACCKCCSAHYPPEIVMLIAPGSFNPVTTMHMRMMELARDAIERTWSLKNQNEESENGLYRFSKRTRDDPSSQYEPIGEMIHNPLIIPRRQIVAAGIYSPVSDAYEKKDGLEPSTSRRRLLRLACASSADWIAVDDWESNQETWKPTKDVLLHFQQRINRISQDIWKKLVETGEYDAESKESNGLPGLATDKWITHRLAETLANYFKWISKFSRNEENKGSTSCDCFCNTQKKQPFENMDHDGDVNSEQRDLLDLCPKVHIKMVCGLDLLESMNRDDSWSAEDIDFIMSEYGVVCISRPDDLTFLKSDNMIKYEHNIIMATELNENGTSATLVRRALSKGYSVRYLVPDAALEEIYATGLYGAKQRSLVNLPDIADLSKMLNKTHSLDRSMNLSNDRLTQHVDVSDGRRKREVFLRTTTQSGSNVCIPLTIQIGSMNESVSQSGQKSSKSVQTRLTALPHQQAPLVLTKISNDKNLDGFETCQSFSAHATLERNAEDYKEFDERSLPKHIDPMTQHHVSAILPLVRQCHRCGSQKVRLILVERPQFPVISKVDQSTEHVPKVASERNQVSVQTDQPPPKKSINKKTQYPSISSKQRANVHEQEPVRKNPEESPAKVASPEVNYSEIKSRRPPPPLPTDQMNTPSVDHPHENVAETAFLESDLDAPKQETLNELISPSSIYALMSSQRLHLNEDYPESYLTGNLIENNPLDNYKHDKSYIDQLQGKTPNSISTIAAETKPKLCKHKRHHYQSKRENTIQSSDMVDPKSFTNFVSPEIAQKPISGSSSHLKTQEKCSKHRDKERKSDKKSKMDVSMTLLSKSIEKHVRRSRTANADKMPLEEFSVKQASSQKTPEESPLIHGRGRSMPSFSSKSIKNSPGSRQNTLTDDSLAELLNEYENNDIIKTIPRQSSKHSHHDHSRQHVSGYQGNQKHYNKPCRHQIISSDDFDDFDDDGEITTGSKNSKMNLKTLGGKSTLDYQQLDYHQRHASGECKQHKTKERRKVRDHSFTERDLMNMLSPKGSMKMSQRDVLESEHSLYMDKELGSSQMMLKSNRSNPDQTSTHEPKTKKSSSGHKCSRHSKGAAVGSFEDQQQQPMTHRNRSSSKLRDFNAVSSPVQQHQDLSAKKQHYSLTRAELDEIKIQREIYEEKIRQLKNSIKKSSRKKIY